LFWPDHPEFVRMAARFGATIVPFGAVGEDDLAQVRFFFFYQSLFGSPLTFFNHHTLGMFEALTSEVILVIDEKTNVKSGVSGVH